LTAQIIKYGTKKSSREAKERKGEGKKSTWRSTFQSFLKLNGFFSKQNALTSRQRKERELEELRRQRGAKLEEIRRLENIIAHYTKIINS